MAPSICGSALTSLTALCRSAVPDPGATAALTLSTGLTYFQTTEESSAFLPISRDVVLGLGSWLSLRTQLWSLVLALALRLKSLTTFLDFTLSCGVSCQQIENELQSLAIRCAQRRIATVTSSSSKYSQNSEYGAPCSVYTYVSDNNAHQ